MKVKQRTVCQACRSRKIGCDGRTPSCTQCLLRGLFCPGYQSDWTFVPQLTKDPPRPRNPSHQSGNPRLAVRRRAKKNGAAAPNAANAGATTSVPAPIVTTARVCSPPIWSAEKPTICPSPSMPLIHVIALVIRGYVPEPNLRFLYPELVPSQSRICGGWVEALPELVGNMGDDVALAEAVKCLGLAIMSGGPARKAPVSAGLEAYASALQCLGKALDKVESPISDDLAASVMCLLIAELMLPTSLDSWAAHVKGFETLMQMSRPENYVSGAPHRLFCGARPTLIILAFLTRKASFMALEPWKTIPFSKERPPPVQALLGDAAIIPSILERIDSLPELPFKEARSVAIECIATFEDLLTRFDDWEDGFRANVQFPSYWIKNIDENGRPCIWFQSISVANALTHYWAVQIVCRDNIAQLRSRFPELSPTSKGIAGGRASAQNVELAIKICEGMDYLIQDDMKLFGPTSVILPLRTAYDTFLAGGDDTKEELEWCKQIVSRILGKGFQFVTLFFDIFQLASPSS